MSRVVFFDKIINQILPGGSIWLNLEDGVISTILTTGKKKLVSTNRMMAKSKSLFKGHVYDVEGLSKLVFEAVSNVNHKRSGNLTVALPVGCSPVQKKLFKQSIQSLGWGRRKLIDRDLALAAWSSYSSKQDNGLVLYLQNSYSEVVAFEENKIQKAERFNWGIDDWIKKIQQHYLESKQSLVPTKQVEKILKTFSVSGVLSGKQSLKLSVRAQDQQTKSTVTLSVNSHDLVKVYEELTKDLGKKLRRRFGSSLGQISGVVIISSKEINGLNRFIQEEFGWDWSGQSSSGHEVVVGMRLMSKVL